MNIVGGFVEALKTPRLVAFGLTCFARTNWQAVAVMRNTVASQSLITTHKPSVERAAFQPIMCEAQQARSATERGVFNASTPRNADGIWTKQATVRERPRRIMERDTKQQSWNQIREFYDDFINDSEFSPEWDYLMPLLRLVETIAKSKRATKFRAGQSHEALIICTSETNTTYPKPAFVGVRMARDHVSFLLEYWKEAGNLVEKRICREEEILPVLDEFLAKLWKNTKGADTEGIA